MERKFSNHNVARCVLFSILFLLVACSAVSDARIDAYRNAAVRVRGASSADEVSDISYSLYKELLALDAESVPVALLRVRASEGCDDSCELLEAIDKARVAYEKELLNKEVERYAVNGKKKKNAKK